MVAVLFSYQGVEAFCNDVLMRASGDGIEIKTKKGDRKRVTRREAERQQSTSEKLGNLVPRILSIPTPKGKAVWEHFLSLQHTRDEVVHLKNQLIHAKDPKQDSDKVLIQLIADDPRKWPLTTMQILDYFVTQPPPDWYEPLKKRLI